VASFIFPSSEVATGHRAVTPSPQCQPNRDTHISRRDPRRARVSTAPER